MRRRRNDERTRSWHVGPSHPKAAGRSTSTSGPSRSPTRTPSRQEFFELEREAIFKRAWLNVGRVEQLPRNGQLLHQGARRRQDLRRRRAGQGRRGPGLPQHLPPPRQQAGLERLPARRRRAASAASSSASTTAGATTSTARAPSSNRSRSSSTSTRPTTASSRCTATSGRGSSSSTWPRSRSRRCATSSGRWSPKLENYPFEQQSERCFYRATVKSNWKLYMDAFQEFYHAPVLHAKQSPPDLVDAARSRPGSRRPPTRSTVRTGW